MLSCLENTFLAVRFVLVRRHFIVIASLATIFGGEELVTGALPSLRGRFSNFFRYDTHPSRVVQLLVEDSAFGWVGPNI